MKDQLRINPPWLEYSETKALALAFSQAGFLLRFVGGCVRDAILPRAAGEFELDAASDARPEQIISLLNNAGIKSVPVGIEHGTVLAVIGDKTFEITTLRRDVATDGRHAEVEFTSSWEEDARRRDFTINALYIDMDGFVYDYVGGIADCQSRIVRFIGNADARIKEDYLRILRYFRFVASIGENKFSETALLACANNQQFIDKLSGERIAREMLKLFSCAATSKAIGELLPLLPQSLPFLNGQKSAEIIARLEEQIAHLHGNDISKDKDSSKDSSKDISNAISLLKLAAIIGENDRLNKIAFRLKLSTKQKDYIQKLLSHIELVDAKMSSKAQKKLLRKLGAENYRALILLAYAFSAEKWSDYQNLLASAAWQIPHFPIVAGDLIAKGIKPGKALGDKLRNLEEIWEESEYSLNKSQLMARIYGAS